MNVGVLGGVIWPPYVGLSTSEGEPFDDPNYGRGLIAWRTQPDGQIFGSAQVLCPKGVFTHIVFYSGPHSIHGPMGDGPQRLEQPVVFDRPGTIEIDPIQCGERLPRAGV